MTRIVWLLRQLGRRLWFRAALFAWLGVGSALLSIWLAPLVPADVSARIGADAVDKVLGIIASSMLTVAIFSLSTMVSAYGAAATGATPRATQLLQQDSGALNALGTFIGAFLFSVVGIIALSTGVYGTSGRLVLFVVTLVVVALVVVTFIGWIDRLSRLGRVGETIDEVARAASEAIARRRAEPFLGGAPARPRPGDAVAVLCPANGYVQHVDMATLGAAAETGAVDVAILPGAFAGKGKPLAFIGADQPAEIAEMVRRAFVIGQRRSFEQDPRFGLIVLSEIASRALSPAVNDPGTAIDVLAAIVRALSPEGETQDAMEPAYPRIFVPALDEADALEDCITPIARDGAGLIEVGMRLQKMLAVIAGMQGLEAAARRQARSALSRGLAALEDEGDRARLRAAAAWAAD